MLSFWKKLTGEIISNSSGHPILCDHCPCKIIIPAGTVISFTLNRTFTRAKDYEEKQTYNGKTVLDNHDVINWNVTHHVEGEYTTRADIEVGDGVWINLIDGSLGTVTYTLDGDGNGTRSVYNPEAGSSDTTTYTGTMPQNSPFFTISARGFIQVVDDGIDRVLKWTKYEGSNTTTTATTDYLTWSPSLTTDQRAWIVDPGSGYSETVTGGTGEKGTYTQNVIVTSMDSETGQATANLVANATCDYTETLVYTVATQKGADSVNDNWTASWTMAMPPCEACMGL
jgi:hypothetical protein